MKKKHDIAHRDQNYFCAARRRHMWSTMTQSLPPPMLLVVGNCRPHLATQSLNGECPANRPWYTHSSIDELYRMEPVQGVVKPSFVVWQWKFDHLQCWKMTVVVKNDAIFRWYDGWNLIDEMYQLMAYVFWRKHISNVDAVFTASLRSATTTTVSPPFGRLDDSTTIQTSFRPKILYQYC